MLLMCDITVQKVSEAATIEEQVRTRCFTDFINV